MRGWAMSFRRLQRQIDQHLGFRTRNQHRRRHLKNATTELGLTHQISQWLSSRPALDPFGELGVSRRNHRRFRPGQQIGVRATGGVFEQQTGIEPVDFAACRGQRLAEGHFQFCSASSASRSA